MELKNFYKKYEREILAIICLFAWILLYFTINNIAKNRTPHLLPNIADKIPFIPVFVLVYFSTYVLVLMPYFIVKNIKEYRKAAYSYLTAIVISSIIFLVYPVTVARESIASTGIFNKLVLLLYNIDKPFNAFPSLHVALSSLSALVCYKANKRIGIIFIIWTFLIAISTLFTKQHYVLDLLAGIILAVAVFWFFNKI